MDTLISSLHLHTNFMSNTALPPSVFTLGTQRYFLDQKRTPILHTDGRPFSYF